jgi:hypothetical protein
MKHARFFMELISVMLILGMVITACESPVDKNVGVEEAEKETPEPEEPEKPAPGEPEPEAPKAWLTSFVFEQGHTGLTEDLVGSIDGDKITVTTQKWIEQIAALKAVFEVEPTVTVTVDGVKQESSVTPHDFRRDVIYTLTAADGGGEQTYTVQFQSPQTTGLPVLKIDTENSAAITSKVDYIKTNFRLLDPNHPEYDLEKTGFKDEIRGRGNSTWNYVKKPYRIKFDKKTALFGREAAKSWVLLANHMDPTLITNTVTLELGQRLGLVYTNHYQHVEVFLNNDYRGSYVLTEQVQTGAGRVDIDEDAGFLVELDMTMDEDPKFYSTRYALPIMLKTPEPADNQVPPFVKDAVNELTDALYNGAGYTEGAAPATAYRDLINRETFIDFMLINEVVRNTEIQYPKSVYMYKDKGGKISMGPLWDFDWAFGYDGTGIVDYIYFRNAQSMLLKRTTSPFPGWGGFGTSPGYQFFWRFFDDAEFKAAYKARWTAMKAEIAGMDAFMDEIAVSLEKSHAENKKRWTPSQSSLGNVNFMAEITKMKSWWKQRVEYLDGEIKQY